MRAVLYGAVRVNAWGGEFVTIEEYSVVRDLVMTLIGTTAAEMPEWHQANPVVRVARFNVREALPRKPYRPRRARVPVMAPAAPLVLIPSATSMAAEMIHFKRSWRNNGVEYAVIRVRDRMPLGKIYRDDTGRWVADVNGRRARHATLAAAKTAALAHA
jgi:hypothetical protein